MSLNLENVWVAPTWRRNVGALGTHWVWVGSFLSRNALTQHYTKLFTPPWDPEEARVK